MTSPAIMERTTSITSLSLPLPLPLPLPPLQNYDVFLSHRAKDTGGSFAADLHEALTAQGIVVYRDDEDEEDRGKPLKEKMKAVEESRSSIVVFSENYGNLVCMKEIGKIVMYKELRDQLVLPIFYQIDPANVRKQKGNFEKHFKEHEANPEIDIEEIQNWRYSMNQVGHLSGWHLQDSQSEAVVINEVVKHIFNKLRPDLFRYDDKLVGITPRLNKINMLLGIGLDDVRFVGIWGMGGIGKTTLARIIYNNVSNLFQGYYFLDNVKEALKNQTLASLQEKLLTGALTKRNIEIPNADGATLIKRRISGIKALIILDDIDHLSQLQKLAGGSDWFGPGSRVLVTTRDEHLLMSHGIERRYNVEGLNIDEALELFSQKAFGEEHPKKGYFDLSSQVVAYAGGLPLAIEVLGSSLRNKPMEQWENAVEKLKEVRDEKIIEKLKISYYMLDDSEQKIFLDIACFFKRKRKSQAIEILQSFGFPAVLGLDILEEKSLISTPHDKIQMHDLIQEMGQEIVRQHFPDEPEKQTRLWLREDINLALSRDEGTEAIEGIMMDMDEGGESHLNAKSFSAMTKLRVLKVNNAYVSEELEYLSDQLRFLNWHGYPLKSLPSNFNPTNLMELELPSSSIHHLWSGSKSSETLKVINLSDSQFLSKTADFSGVPNLERLVLSGCVGLHQLHQSLGNLKHLIQLDLKNCKKLTTIPFNISLESLNILVLSGCSNLTHFPKISGNMNHLLELHLDETSIKILHPSIAHLTSLVLLNLKNCTNLLKLPTTIGCLTSLKTLNLHGCSKLDSLPESLGNISFLEKLDITNTCVNQAPMSLQLLSKLEILNCQGLSRKFLQSLFPTWNFTKKLVLSHYSQGLKLTNLFHFGCSLKVLDLSDCNLWDGDLPNDLHSLCSLQILNLSQNHFTELHESICHLVNLRDLFLVECFNLLCLPKLPLSVRDVEARDCVSLKEYYNQEKHIPSSEMGMTIIRCPITNEPSESYKIDQPGLSAIHLRTITQRYIEVLTWQQEKYFFVIPYPNFIACFDEKRYGFSITAHCPPDYINEENPRIGIALGAAFEVQKHEISSNNNNNSKICCEFIVKMETDEFPLKSALVFDGQKDELASPMGLSVFYIPMKRISSWLNQCCCIDVSIITDNPFVKVKWCGASILYEQNAGSFIGKIIKAFFGSPGKYHTSIVEHILNHQKRVDVSTLLDGGARYKTSWMNAMKRTIGSFPRLRPSKPPREVIEDCSTMNASFEAEESESDYSIMLRRNLKATFLRTFEELKFHGEYYIFPQKEISRSWFNFQLKEPKITIKIPPNLHKDKKWMGLAFFVLFSVDENSPKSHSFSYQVDNDEYTMERESILYLNKGFFNDFHQLWLFFEPRAVYPYRLNQWRHLRFSFVCNNSDFKAVLCGARLVYKQDLEGFINTIVSNVLSSPAELHEFYDQTFVEAMLRNVHFHKYEPKQKEEERRQDLLIQEWEEQNSNACPEEDSSCSSNMERSLILQLKETIPSFLQKDIKDRFENTFDFVIPRINFPQLFNQLPPQNHTGIKFPPNLYTNNDWMGFAVCTLFQIIKHPTAILNNLGSVSRHELICQFAIENGLIEPLHTHSITEDRSIWLNERQFVWLYYTPRNKYGEIFRHRSSVWAIIEADSPDLMVKCCGLQLVYKKDMEVIDKILMKAIESSS